MSDPVICVENLSKKYTLSHQQKNQSYQALRDVLADGAKAMGRWLVQRGATQTPSKEEFWALRDVSFEIQQGDRVGIVGRNGAGKSTLLKILSQIVEPTTGQIRIKGRVASLLEVGTGFHPELTGRENIFLNGAILGMRRAEIKQKFNEIVAFAEVEKFLDTPVKRYSSGMYVRLAFAVAAHLEPEILIVDEVLAVGDAQFQKKCLGKIQDVSEQGRTILFVSHNMQAVQTLCPQGILLSHGELVTQSSIDEVIKAYTCQIQATSACLYQAKRSSAKPYFKYIEIYQDDCSNQPFEIDKPIKIRFELETFGKHDLNVGVKIFNEYGTCVHHVSDEFFEDCDLVQSAKHRLCIFPAYALAPGSYNLYISLTKRNIEFFDKVVDKLAFEVEFTGKMADRTTSSAWHGNCGPGIANWKGDAINLGGFIKSLVTSAMGNIAFLTHYTDLYGANRSLLNLITGLSKYDITPYVIAPRQGDIIDELKQMHVEFAIIPFEWWIFAALYNHNFLKSAYQFLRHRYHAVKHLQQNYACLKPIAAQLSDWNIDLVYTNSSVTPVGALAAKQLGLPHIWHLREFIDLDYGLEHDWGKISHDDFIRRSGTRIAVSRAILEHFSDRNHVDNSYLIPNGVAPLAQFEHLRNCANLTKRLGDRYTFALVGNCHPAKGHIEAIKALSVLVAKFPNVRLLIVGDGSGEYCHKLQQLVGALGLSDKVEFWGYRHNPYEAYFAADAVLMCSKSEAMGRVTVEAMSACRPVIGYDNAGTSEIIQHERTGLLYRDGYTELASCMQCLVEHAEWGKQLGMQAWHIARQKYNVESYAEQIYQVIQSVLTRCPDTVTGYRSSLS